MRCAMYLPEQSVLRPVVSDKLLATVLRTLEKADPNPPAWASKTCGSRRIPLALHSASVVPDAPPLIGVDRIGCIVNAALDIGLL